MTAPAPVKRMYVPPAEAVGGAPTGGPTSFLGGLLSAALIPVRGSGLVWVLGIAGATMLGTVMMAVTACMWPVALALGTMVMLVTVAMMARYFSACLVSARNGWKTPEHSLLEVDMGDALRQGAAVLVWFLLACAPLFTAVHGATRYMEAGSASMWIGLISAAAVLPMVLWPAALAQANVEGSMMGLFDPMGMIRLIGRSPLSYLAVLFVPVLVSMSPSVVMSLMAVTAPLWPCSSCPAGMLVSTLRLWPLRRTAGTSDPDLGGGQRGQGRDGPPGGRGAGWQRGGLGRVDAAHLELRSRGHCWVSPMGWVGRLRARIE